MSQNQDSNKIQTGKQKTTPPTKEALTNEEDEFEDFDDYGNCLPRNHLWFWQGGRVIIRQTLYSKPTLGRCRLQAAAQDWTSHFAYADWDERLEDPENAQIWVTSWDNDDVSDKFSAALRARLAEKKENSLAS